MASLRRHRRGGIAEAEDYDDGDDGSSGTAPDIDTATEQEEEDQEEEEEEEEHYLLHHLGLHSMTAKVHCSILLLPTNACHGGMN